MEISPYYIGEYPVTQALWESVMGQGSNPSQFIGEDRPVESVSWVDIVIGNQNDNGRPAFLQRLNEATVTSRPAGYEYRLPTEAEWEHAARSNGSYEYAGSDQWKDVGWFNQNSHGETKAVGLKVPNNFGLYDMSGDVEEWCLDRYSNHFFQKCHEEGMVKNPVCHNDEVQGMVLRGAAFDSTLQFRRLSYRGNWFPDHLDPSVGFRLALAKVHTNI